MALSTEKISNDFLSLNICGVQYLSGLNYVQKRPNGRIDYHILYIYEGKCTVHEKNKETVAHAGDMILYKPGEIQHYSFDGADKTVSCYIHFSGTECEHYLKKFDLFEKRITHIGISQKIRNVFTKLEYENLVKRSFSDEYCSALILELLLLLGRKSKNLTSPNIDIEPRINSVRNEMIKTSHEWLDIKHYADMCNLSISRFQHVFKEQAGLSPREYLMYIRITRASSLLVETNLSVSQIADVLGFSSSTYFIRCFKKQTGKTPFEYQKNNK